MPCVEMPLGPFDGTKTRRLAVPRPYYRGGIPKIKVDEWWAVTGSNCRHPRCKRGALPTELTAHPSGKDLSASVRPRCTACQGHAEPIVVVLGLSKKDEAPQMRGFA